MEAFFSMDKGIILIALGNSYYGRVAFNMALSIKANQPDCHITILCQASAMESLSGEMLKVFDNFIEAEENHYMQNGIYRYLKAKTFIYDLSPYQHTIYIDVDALWLPGRKPEEAFNSLQDVNFAIGCHTQANMETCISEKTNYIYWGDLKEIKKYYQIEKGTIPQTQSAFIYFRKSPRMKAYFDLVKTIYDDEEAPYTPWINDGKGDEYAFNVACLLSGIMPHAIPYYPTHFFQISPIYNDPDLCKNYYAIQMGGGKCDEWITEAYNRMVKKYYQQAGINPGFLHQDKKRVIDERNGW